MDKKELEKVTNVTNVLILSKDLQFQGGVVNFVRMLIKHASPNTRCEHFRIGQKVSGRSKVVKWFYPIYDNIRLISRIKRGDIDCVHLNPSLNLKALVRDGTFLLALRLMRFRKILVFVHGWEDNVAKKLLRWPWLRFIFRAIYKPTSVTIVLANSFKNDLVKMGFHPDAVLVGTTMFDGAIFNKITRTVANSGPTILFMSRFVKEKGIYESLEAFEGIKKRFPDARLIMAGDGPEKPNMHEWVKSHNLAESIFFPGYLRDSAKVQVLRDADLFLFPTYYGEGCPVVLLEAMAAGLPVVTTPAGGIADIFTDGKNGILLNDVRPEVIEKAVTSLLSDTVRMASTRANNQQIAWSSFEANIVTAKLEGVYREMAQDG